MLWNINSTNYSKFSYPETDGWTSNMIARSRLTRKGTLRTENKPKRSYKTLLK